MNRFSRTIVTVIAVVVAGATIAPTISAQTDYSNRKATSFLTVGPGFAGGASLAVDPPEGMKVGPIFAWRATAEVAYPLSPSISATFGLGLDSRGTKNITDVVNEDVWYNTRVNYLSIQPGIVLSGFYLGMNFGFPMSGTNTNQAGVSADFETDNVETLLEPRIGGVIVLLNDKTGWLALSITGGYSLNDFGSVGGMASGHMGLAYQFTIPGTGKR